MKIKVNGKDMEVKENITIKELLDELKIAQKTMAAAVNMQVVKKEDWCKRVIKEGDKVEFLNFVGGG